MHISPNLLGVYARKAQFVLLARSSSWQFVIQYWNVAVVGILLGAVVGLASPTVYQIALKFGASAEFLLRPSGSLPWCCCRASQTCL